MKKQSKILIVLGLLVAVLPTLGFPGDIESSIIVMLGLLIAVGVYVLEKMITNCDDCNVVDSSIENCSNEEDVFIENAPEEPAVASDAVEDGSESEEVKK